ncbi:glycoside hydrolase family 32 protein [Erysipelotrichaceae bacterium RD49]|nr:glycoside hydrolase family 32 protein [Erysipelotrichaceae bacterium RD49]
MQKIHLETNQGLINDPNGLCQFRHTYYVFCQWNPLKKDHTHKEWAMFTSKDLIHWKQHASPLKLGEPFDRDGTYSGSAIEQDGAIFVYYTGNVKCENRYTNQCLAVSENGVDFHKKGVVLPTPPGITRHFRDPKVFQDKDGMIYMLVGAQTLDQKGKILLARSENGIDFDYLGIIAKSQIYEMIECPDLITDFDQDLYLYCLQGRDPITDEVTDSFAVYQVTPKDRFKQFEPLDLDHNWQKLDEGLDFFAPQTFIDKKGRRMMIGWMSRLDDNQERLLFEKEPNAHCLSFPRVLTWKNDRLIQTLAEEFESLKTTSHPIEITSNGLQGKTTNRLAYLKIERSPSEQSGQPFRLVLNAGELIVTWKPKTCELIRKDWAQDREETKTFPLDEIRTIEVWVDESSFELFVNQGEQVLSARVKPLESHFSFEATDGQARLFDLEGFTLEKLGSMDLKPAGHARKEEETAIAVY